MRESGSTAFADVRLKLGSFAPAESADCLEQTLRISAISVLFKSALQEHRPSLSADSSFNANSPGGKRRVTLDKRGSTMASKINMNDLPEGALCELLPGECHRNAPHVQLTSIVAVDDRPHATRSFDIIIRARDILRR